MGVRQEPAGAASCLLDVSQCVKRLRDLSSATGRPLHHGQNRCKFSKCEKQAPRAMDAHSCSMWLWCHSEDETFVQ